jgi:hypothetical protein
MPSYHDTSTTNIKQKLHRDATIQLDDGGVWVNDSIDTPELGHHEAKNIETLVTEQDVTILPDENQV